MCHSISISMICEGQCSLTCIRRENDKDRKDSGASDDTKKGKLDFIAQEMNREANTILSKANDLEISDTGINLKTDIEKVREQIQNIE